MAGDIILSPEDIRAAMLIKAEDHEPAMGSPRSSAHSDEPAGPDGDDEPGKAGLREESMSSDDSKINLELEEGSSKRAIRRSAGSRGSGEKLGLGSSPVSPTAALRTIVPKTAADWEPWRPILQELYMRQNRILRDIITIMETAYGLKAT
jgi:hypothetical protein